MVSQKKPSGAARNSRAGGIAKRRSAARTDRDGDLVMDPTARARSGGGISKAKSGAPTGRDKSTKTTKSGIHGADFQQKLLKHVGSSSVRTSRAQPSRGLEEIRITGHKTSKAASNPDGGLKSLILFLEKKASLKSKRPVTVKKSRIEGDDIVISLPSEDSAHVLRLDGYVFAGANIKVERAAVQDQASDSAKTQETRAMLKGVLEKRYNPELKLLDLSALASDPDLKEIFDSSSTTSKFFPALMIILEQQFKSFTERNNAIISVTLANNGLSNIKPVTALAPTLPQLKNLDLSNNVFMNLEAIEAWRRKFPKLDQLIVSGNPLEQTETDFALKLTNWYPKLRILNGIQVRSDEEAERGLQLSEIPYPIRVPVFNDEGQIAETFVRNFFVGFDSDRAALAQHYYDEQSEFSLSVNTSAPRDPANTQEAGPQEWDLWIKRSRNLKKITQLPARQNRLFKGAQALHETWASLPTTRHPSLESQPEKWLIECQAQPGLPDPTGASPCGVDGFLVTVHGEFEEIDVSTNQPTKKRSFDRSFCLGPGGPTGVRVVSDILNLRTYGGSNAFRPENNDASVPVQTNVAAPPTGLPTGLTPELAEQMIIQLQQATSMTVSYAKDCLEQVQWNYDSALEIFNAVRATLPPDAFIQAI